MNFARKRTSAARPASIDRNRSPELSPASADGSVLESLYLLLGSGIGLFFLLTVDSGPIVDLPVKLVFVAVLVLTIKRWTGALLLALIQLNVFLLEQRFQEPISLAQGLFWIFVTTSLVAFVSRYRLLKEHHPVGAGLSLRQLTRALLQSTETNGRLADSLAAFRGNLVRLIIVVGGCAIVAFVALQSLPDIYGGSGFDPVQAFLIKPSGYRTLASGLLLFICFLPVWLIINEICWRTMTPSQASVYARSAFVSWIHRDLRMIVKKKIKLRRASAGKLRAPKPIETEPDSEGIV